MQKARGPKPLPPDKKRCRSVSVTTQNRSISHRGVYLKIRRGLARSDDPSESEPQAVWAAKGTEPPPKKKSRNMAISVTVQEKEKLDQLSAVLGVSQSEIVRHFMRGTYFVSEQTDSPSAGQARLPEIGRPAVAGQEPLPFDEDPASVPSVDPPPPLPPPTAVNPPRSTSPVCPFPLGKNVICTWVGPDPRDERDVPEDVFWVGSPYHAEFRERIKDLPGGASWFPEWRAWRVDLSQREAVLGLLKQFFGYTPPPS